MFGTRKRGSEFGISLICNIIEYKDDLRYIKCFIIHSLPPLSFFSGMEDFIPTRSSRLKANAVENFVSVSYNAPKKVTNINKNNEQNMVRSSNTTSTLDRKRQQELEMKKARYDVIKFGISAFQGEEAKEAKTALAVRLGAKPPKNKNINYKVLQAQKKKEKDGRKKEEHVSGLMQSMTKYKKNKVRKKEASSILGIYGKVSKDLFQKNN